MASFQLLFHDFPWVHFIHNDSGNGSLETSVDPKQSSEYADMGCAEQQSLGTHVNIFIPNVSMLPEQWTANLVIKSILLSTESTENL